MGGVTNVTKRMKDAVGERHHGEVGTTNDGKSHLPQLLRYFHQGHLCNLMLQRYSLRAEFLFMKLIPE